MSRPFFQDTSGSKTFQKSPLWGIRMKSWNKTESPQIPQHGYELRFYRDSREKDYIVIGEYRTKESARVAKAFKEIEVGAEHLAICLSQHPVLFDSDYSRMPLFN